MFTGTLPPASNRATFTLTMTVWDSEVGEAFDLTDVAEITWEVRDPATLTSMLTATIDDGVNVDDADEGIVTISFTATQMRTLDPKEYEVGCTVEFTDETQQFIAARQPIIDGIVS